jgi:sodium pump decarboxylase gamma subunit
MTPTLSLYERVVDAVVYSFIAFSIVFIVLGGLTLVIYGMRLLTGSGDQPKKPETKAPIKSEPAAAVSGADVKAKHTAAITAAILALTGGRGGIIGIYPTGKISSEGTRVWRASGIIEAAGRRVAPAWKR